MSRFRRFELIEQPLPLCYSSPFQTLTFPSFVGPSLDLDLDLLVAPSPFDAVADLFHAPTLAYRRVESQLETELRLQSLGDRVAELESRFDRLLGGDRKYTWTAEIKGAEKNGFDRKYKWVAEIVEEEKKKKKQVKKVVKDKNMTWTIQLESEDEEEEEKKKKRLVKGVAKNVKWTAEITGKGDNSGSSKKYTFQVESGDAEKKEKVKEKGKEKEKKKGNGLRIVEIHEPSDHRDVVLRQVGWPLTLVEF